MHFNCLIDNIKFPCYCNVGLINKKLKITFINSFIRRGDNKMKKICIFLLLTFILTWSAFLVLWTLGGLQNPMARIVLACCMLIPAISAVITTFVTKEKFKDVWIKPNFKGHIKYYLIAWFLPMLLIILGAVAYYLIFPSHFDSSMALTISALKKQYSAIGTAVPNDSALRMLLIVQILTAIVLAPILNFIPCLGEELGWRGYLLPNLCKKYSPLTSTLLTGVIWGIWHAPIIAMGYNYGLGYWSAPFGGIFAMILFCIFAGSLFSYLAIKTKSCLPTAIGHGIINGFASASFLFLAIPNPSTFLGPAPTGLIGGIGFIAAGGFCLYLIAKITDVDAA